MAHGFAPRFGVHRAMQMREEGAAILIEPDAEADAAPLSAPRFYGEIGAAKLTGRGDGFQRQAQAVFRAAPQWSSRWFEACDRICANK